MATKKLTKPGMPSSSKSLVDKVDLFAIGLDSMNANLDRANYAIAYGEDNKRITRHIESGYRVSDYSEEHFDITGTLFLRIEANGFKDPILSLDVAVTGHFHPKTKLSRQEAESFALSDARLIIWPYFRQIVSDTTSRMHIGTITLPLSVS